MVNEDMDFAARYASWDTADLERAATIEASEFRPEALAAILVELERRGIAPAQVQPPTPAEAPRGVGGLLLLLVVSLGLSSLGGLSGAIVFLHESASGLAESLLGLAGIVLNGYGLSCCVLIVAKHRLAPAFTAGWFIVALMLTIVFIVSFNRMLPTAAMPLAAAGVLLAFQSSYTGFWLVYLARSKRVKATFS